MKRCRCKIDIYLEIGAKRTFAGAIAWPGWCRSGRDEASAIQSLFAYRARYSRVLRAARLGFQVPTEAEAFIVVERLKGNATTDFGAPGIAPASDARALDDEELNRYQAVLKASWRALDAAAAKAEGKKLRTGPRGGGRDMQGIVRHVQMAEAAYLGQLGWKRKMENEEDSEIDLQRARKTILLAVAAAARGELPKRGPRGGVHWTPRYFVRRAAWHVLDHVWELEDRLL